jgi:hypothetical protein
MMVQPAKRSKRSFYDVLRLRTTPCGDLPIAPDRPLPPIAAVPIHSGSDAMGPQTKAILLGANRRFESFPPLLKSTILFAFQRLHTPDAMEYVIMERSLMAQRDFREAFRAIAWTLPRTPTG